MSTAFDAGHFDRLGAAYDRFLPHIQPVTEAILASLPTLPPDALVLDLACGTGEPGLTLARRQPSLRLLGVDPAEGMLAVARRKADGMPRASFEAMPIERLRLRDASVDAAISRFGLLLFGDPAASAGELARVLKPGGAFSFAVWEDKAGNTFLALVIEMLGSQLEPERMPDFGQFDHLAESGRREGWLRDAGIRRVDSELFRWQYEFPDAETAWSFVAGVGMFAHLIEPLDENRRQALRRRLDELLEPYRTDQGYSLPQSCRLYRGRR